MDQNETIIAHLTQHEQKVQDKEKMIAYFAYIAGSLSSAGVIAYEEGTFSFLEKVRKHALIASVIDGLSIDDVDKIDEAAHKFFQDFSTKEGSDYFAHYWIEAGFVDCGDGAEE
jgi:hypothetical protein